MREKIIAGNWKMNTSPEEGVSLARSVAEHTAEFSGVTVVVCPPATHLHAVSLALEGTHVLVGAQNVHWETKGAFTGELSPAMLTGVGCKFAIIGHSERRQYFGETDETVNLRLKRTLASGLRPIVCIGELIEERKAGRTFDVLRQQLKVGLEGVIPTGSDDLVIAYEPVWAIGTGQTATTDQAEEAHQFIRGLLGELFGTTSAETTVIQYGGSMNGSNAAELMACPNVDGGLVGGASLNVDQFRKIVQAAAN